VLGIAAVAMSAVGPSAAASILAVVAVLALGGAAWLKTIDMSL